MVYEQVSEKLESAFATVEELKRELAATKVESEPEKQAADEKLQSALATVAELKRELTALEKPARDVTHVSYFQSVCSGAGKD